MDSSTVLKFKSVIISSEQFFIFFFSSRRRHTRSKRDWSSDVCSSDLDQGRDAETTWKMALAYLYFTPGVPMIYQGSEIPMYGPGFPENQNMVEFTSS